MEMLRAFFGKFRRNADGAVLVETAIITPLLITIFVGTCELSAAVYTYLELEKSVRGATRYLANVSADCTTCATEIATAKGIVTSGVPLNGYATAVTVSDPVWTSVTIPAAGGSPSWTSDIVELTANVSISLPLLSVLGLPTSMTLSSTQQEWQVNE